LSKKNKNKKKKENQEKSLHLENFGSESGKLGQDQGADHPELTVLQGWTYYILSDHSSNAGTLILHGQEFFLGSKTTIYCYPHRFLQTVVWTEENPKTVVTGYRLLGHSYMKPPVKWFHW
jgi:hypothetical protein